MTPSNGGQKDAARLTGASPRSPDATVELLRDADAADSRYIWLQAFEGGNQAAEAMRSKTGGFTVGVRDGAGLQCAVRINPFRAHFGTECVLSIGAVDGVATLPAGRGRGYASLALEEAIRRMRESGHALSALEPFDWDFYRAFGWDWIAPTRTYRAPARILPAHPGTAAVREARQDDRPGIAACYDRFARRYRGMIARDEAHWGDILDDTATQFTYSYVYQDDGCVQGYLTYRGGNEERITLRELIATSGAARSALLALLRRMHMQTESFAWRAPVNDPLWFALCHQDVSTSERPWVMGRVVDVVAALEGWRPDPSARGAVVVAVEDEHAPWNAACWRVDFADTTVSVTEVSSDADVALDIQSLGQVFWGAATLDAMRAAGRVRVGCEAGYSCLRDFLRGPPSWISDDF